MIIERRLAVVVMMLLGLLGSGAQVMSKNEGSETHLKVGKVYHGFLFKAEKKIKEINARGRYFIHQKSGARLLKLETDDDNQAFSITFRTLPSSDNGVAHVLEHSVLNGSRKYPAKSPFEILTKGSFATFLNAGTSADRTFYPIASRNRKDFFNLMDVYLDAVFYPHLYREPKIMMQEGWHYHIENAADPLEYNGIVYNEMKGALSSPESVFWSKLPELLLPDTIYAYESGGFPEAIPELNQQDFVSFHRKFYHPSNSYIFLYGNGRTVEELAYLDDNFLKDFEKRERLEEIALQPPFDEMKEATYDYPIMGETDEADKTLMAIAFVLDHKQDKAERMAMDILSQLLESSSSPLRQALMQSGMGKDMQTTLYSGIRQPLFSIILKNTNPSEKEQFIKLVYKTLEEMVEKGIDKKLLESILNTIEFDLREANYGGFPKGLVYNFINMATWMYEGDPFTGLQFERVLKKLRKKLSTDYYEQLIKKSFLENKQRGFFLIKPKKNLGLEREAMLKARLAKIKASMTEQEITRIIEQTLELKEYQKTPDSAEDIAKVPLLTLADINPEAKKYVLEVKKENDVTILHYPVFTNDITYVQFLFDTSGVPQELIPYVSLLTEVLGELNTKNKRYTDLETDEKLHTGGISYYLDVLIKDDDPAKINPLFVIKSKSLTPKIDRSFEIQSEIVKNTIFHDTERLKEVIQRLRSQKESRLNQRGIGLAITRLRSHLSPYGTYQEATNGLSYYKFLAELDRTIDTQGEQVAQKLEQVARYIFNKQNLVVGITAPASDYKKCLKLLPGFLAGLGDVSFPQQKYSFTLEKQNEGLLSTSKVNYVVKGFNFKRLGYTYSGKLDLLERILSFDYLHNKIRDQGGAYGAFANISRSGFITFSSYRDPHLIETLEHYNELVSYLHNFDISDRDMTRFIIGKVAELDRPLTPSMKGERAIDYYLEDIRHEDLQRERTEILTITPDDIKALAPMMADIIKNSAVCVFGNESKIKEYSEIFDALVQVVD